MAERTLRKEERAGLIAAVILHAALLVVLAVRPSSDEPVAMPERMTVNLASEVGLEATAPDPVPESREAIAPVLADTPAPVPLPEPEPLPRPLAELRPQPRPTAAPQPRPTAAPTRAADERPRRRPDPPRTQPRAQPSQPAGGSRLGSDFLDGAGNSQTTTERRIPASQIGASAQASIVQAIVRQIRPHWQAPQGVDAELLVTQLAFDLDEDGRLKGRPRVIDQSGITDSNRPQASLHAERAIRAVQLAAPFDLPPEYYNAWKSVRGARFDRNLSR